MQIKINEKLKTVEFWLNTNEVLDKNKMEYTMKEYSQNKYFPIIYHSGKKDFIDNTIGLLKNNLQLST